VKRFGDRAAVAGADLRLAEGECVAVLGPNGAGKTTLLRMLATLLRPDTGSLRIAGHDLPDRAGRARGLIGYLGHDPLLYLDLTAWQNLELFADLYGVQGSRRRIEEMLDRVGLLTRAYDTVRGFSRGMAQRLGIARLLLHRPSLLLLDEPHASLDASGQMLLDSVLADARGAQGVVIVTHDVERGLSLADRAVVMLRGRVVVEEERPGLDPAAFRARYDALVGAA
jgi:heme exporter protein A